MKKQKITYAAANRQLKKILSYIESIRYAWDSILDLKLYDIFFQCDDLLQAEIEKNSNYSLDLKSDDLFYDFCNLSYENFLDRLQGRFQVEDQRNYIGRTSKFYLSKFHNLYTDGGCKYPYKSKIVYMEAFLYDNFNIDLSIDNNGKIFPYISDTISYGDALEADKEDLEYIISGKLYWDIHRFFEPVLLEYKIITEFKENQVEHFKDFLQSEIEWKISEIEDEKEAEKQEKENFSISTIAAIII